MRKTAIIILAIFLAVGLCGCDRRNGGVPEADVIQAQEKVTGQPKKQENVTPAAAGKQPDVSDGLKEPSEAPETVSEEPKKQPDVTPAETGKQPNASDGLKEPVGVPEIPEKAPSEPNKEDKQPEVPSEPDKQPEQGNESGSVSKGTSDGTDIVLGTWYNRDDLSEEWVFSENQKVTINGEEYDYSVLRLSVFGYRIKVGNRVFVLDDDRDWNGSIYLWRSGESVTLLSEYSEEYKSFVRTQTILAASSELLSRYPDKDGWILSGRSGDIPLLANADYIERFEETGFLVSTPEELASFCYYVNTQDYGFSAMQLMCDIDLSGYEWAPMGWYEGRNDHPFCCLVDGAGHTIKNMTIHGKTNSVGFIGWETGCLVTNLTFENASVTGPGMVGIVAGQAIGGVYENVRVSGTVSGSQAGTMLGWDANCRKRNCTADVTVNGKVSEFLSYNDSEKSKIVIENPVTITIDENHTVTRPEVEGYSNLGWMVFYNGEQVLHRNAENEYSYTYFLEESGTYEIYLTAYVSGQYVPISNTVSYTIE